MRRANAADAAGQHNRFVVGVAECAVAAGRRVFESAEVTGDGRAAEFVVERGRADGAV